MNTNPQTQAYVLVERRFSGSPAERFIPGGGDWRWQLMSRGVPSIGRTLADAMEDAYTASKAEIFVYRIMNGAHYVEQTILRTEVESVVQRRDFFKATARFCELRIQLLAKPAMANREISTFCKCGHRSHEHARLMSGEIGVCTRCRECDGYVERPGFHSEVTGLPVDAVIVDAGDRFRPR